MLQTLKTWRLAVLKERDEAEAARQAAQAARLAALPPLRRIVTLTNPDGTPLVISRETLARIEETLAKTLPAVVQPELKKPVLDVLSPSSAPEKRETGMPTWEFVAGLIGIGILFFNVHVGLAFLAALTVAGWSRKLNSGPPPTSPEPEWASQKYRNQ